MSFKLLRKLKCEKRRKSGRKEREILYYCIYVQKQGGMDKNAYEKGLGI
jgi:hypothetical protein